MSLAQEILEYNKEFVANKKYKKYSSARFPAKRLAVLSCMDTRLTKLLPAAMNIKNGEIKIITNAGAIITHPFGSVMRSLLIAIYELNVQEIAVVGHHDCGMQGLEADHIIQKMLKRGIAKEKIEMIDYCGVNFKKWMQGFADAKTSVQETLALVRRHPLIPADIQLYGFLIDPETGKLDPV